MKRTLTSKPTILAKFNEVVSQCVVVVSLVATLDFWARRDFLFPSGTSLDSVLNLSQIQALLSV